MRLAFPTNFRLGCIGQLGPNTLAYCKQFEITAVESFVTLGSGPHKKYLPL